MQTEKSQPKGKRIMSETSLTGFPALSVGPKVGVSRSASILCLTYGIKILISICHVFFFFFDMPHNDPLQTSFGVFVVADK